MTTTSLQTIKKIFDKNFAAWDLVLPEASLREQTPGSISQSGWTINYRYGRDHDQPYLEYFATHRMTNDTLNRIYADGREELLGFCQEFYLAGDVQAQQQYYQHNRRFYEDVEKRGLL